jgi:putative addiction module antidote
MTLKLTAVGNSTGVILPKGILTKLGVARGDSLYVLETPNGIELTPYDPEFERQMETARDFMKKRHGVLRELAKSLRGFGWSRLSLSPSTKNRVLSMVAGQG